MRYLRALKSFPHRLWHSGKSRSIAIAIPLIALALIVGANFTTIREDVMFAYDPNAGRAYRYGISHMSANNPKLYDIERAKMFLEKSRDLDPAFPGVNYQLARIYFVQRHPVLSLMSANAEIRNAKGDPMPEVYYMKGLVEGAIGEYDTAAEDYRTFLSLTTFPKNGWAGFNDYAWVLLKGGKPEDALAALDEGLAKYPGNAWLLTLKTSTLFELSRFEEARVSGEAAITAADALTEAEWRSAYPGNDPRTATRGLETIRRSSRENIDKIRAEIAKKK